MIATPIPTPSLPSCVNLNEFTILFVTPLTDSTDKMPPFVIYNWLLTVHSVNVPKDDNEDETTFAFNSALLKIADPPILYVCIPVTSKEEELTIKFLILIELDVPVLLLLIGPTSTYLPASFVVCKLRPMLFVA